MRAIGIVSVLLNIILILFILAVVYVPVVSGWLFNRNPEGFFKGIDSVWGLNIRGIYIDNEDEEGAYTLVPRPYGDGLKAPLPVKVKPVE